MCAATSRIRSPSGASGSKREVGEGGHDLDPAIDGRVAPATPRQGSAGRPTAPTRRPPPRSPRRSDGGTAVGRSFRKASTIAARLRSARARRPSSCVMSARHRIRAASPSYAHRPGRVEVVSRPDKTRRPAWPRARGSGRHGPASRGCDRCGWRREGGRGCGAAAAAPEIMATSTPAAIDCSAASGWLDTAEGGAHPEGVGDHQPTESLPASGARLPPPPSSGSPAGRRSGRRPCRA